MKNIFLLIILFFRVGSISASFSDSTVLNERASVLVIPYKPAMHLSDADIHIAEGSEMDIQLMRTTLRQGLIKELNKNFAEIYDVSGIKNDFVMDNNEDIDALYHAVYFQSDSVYPLKDPARFAIKDTTRTRNGASKNGNSKNSSTKIKPETTYINVGMYDQVLIPELADKHDADYLIFLNEIDINTHFDDCLNLALKIYRRDLKVHYTIFDKRGKQIYGDVAVSHFGSNSNDVNEIMNKNFPSIANYILNSLDKATRIN